MAEVSCVMGGNGKKLVDLLMTIFPEIRNAVRVELRIAVDEPIMLTIERAAVVADAIDECGEAAAGLVRAFVLHEAGA